MMAGRYVEPKPEIPFKIYVEGKEITGTFMKTSEITFLVFLQHHPPMQLAFENGAWGTMWKVDRRITDALGDFIQIWNG